MSGKGMAPRKGYNQQRYAENYDGIFRRTQNTMNNDGKKTNQVLPWHRDAAGEQFPIHPEFADEGPGMTLRDWLASKASEADILLNVPETCGELAKLFKVSLHELNSGHTLRARCEARYAYADAMIAARKGTP